MSRPRSRRTPALRSRSFAMKARRSRDEAVAATEETTVTAECRKTRVQRRRGRKEAGQGGWEEERDTGNKKQTAEHFNRS